MAMVEEVEAGQHVVFTQLMSWWAKQNLQLRSVDKVEHKDWTVSDVIITTYHDSRKKKSLQPLKNLLPLEHTYQDFPIMQEQARALVSNLTCYL